MICLMSFLATSTLKLSLVIDTEIELLEVSFVSDPILSSRLEHFLI